MRRKKSGNRFRIALLVFVFLLSIFLFLHSSVFNVAQINVQGNERVSKDEVLALSGLSTGKNIFKFNANNVVKSIEAHPLVKHAEIKRKPPRTVSITITERQMWAIVPAGNVFLIIDDSGVCFEKLDNLPFKNYPLITMDQMPAQINLGQAVDSKATDMVKQVWLAMPENVQPKISEFHYLNNESSLKLYTMEGTEVRFGNLERLDEKIKTLVQVLQLESTMHKQGRDTLEYVDLRFNGEPVLKTKS